MFFKDNLLIIIDGSYYLYRAYYAFPLLKNHLDEPCGAIYGVLNMLKRLLIRYQPKYLAIVFDAEGKTFRHNLFKNYKSNRTPMPYKLQIQIKSLIKIIKAMGIYILFIKNVEADDVIGTIALAAAKDNINVLISTNDKDMAQLVSNKINLINNMFSTSIGPEDVKLKFGVYPKLIIDYLALIGDKSDNIPGISGIGEKTAKILLQEFGSLDNIYNQINSIKIMNFRGAQNIALKLNKYKDIAFLSYQLATIKTNIALNISYNQLIVQIKTLNILLHHYKLIF